MEPTATNPSDMLSEADAVFCRALPGQDRSGIVINGRQGGASYTARVNIGHNNVQWDAVLRKGRLIRARFGDLATAGGSRIAETEGLVIAELHAAIDILF